MGKQKQHVSGPHIYVNAVAVDTSCQGQGHSSRLMRQVNAYADSLSLPLYLETSGSRNVAIYQRFGYRVVDCFSIHCDSDSDNSEALEEYAMLRPAQESELLNS